MTILIKTYRMKLNGMCVYNRCVHKKYLHNPKGITNIAWKDNKPMHEWGFSFHILKDNHLLR